MTETFTTIGIVATSPRHVVTHEGLPITSFRLASTARRYNRSTEQWESAATNWFTVTAFRQLALNAATSLAKGERVIVSGRLKIRDWNNGDQSGTTVEIDATAIGHDLTLGTSTYVRNIRAESATADAAPDASTVFDPDEAVAAIPADAASAGVDAARDEPGDGPAAGDPLDLSDAGGLWEPATA